MRLWVAGESQTGWLGGEEIAEGPLPREEAVAARWPGPRA